MRSKKELDNFLDDFEDIFYNKMLEYYRCRLELLLKIFVY